MLTKQISPTVSVSDKLASDNYITAIVPFSDLTQQLQ